MTASACIIRIFSYRISSIFCGTLGFSACQRAHAHVVQRRVALHANNRALGRLHKIHTAFEIGVRPGQAHRQRRFGIWDKGMHRQLGHMQAASGRQRRQAHVPVVHHAAWFRTARGDAARQLQRRRLGFGGQRRVIAQLHVKIGQARSHLAWRGFVLERHIGAFDGNAGQLHIPGFGIVGGGFFGVLIGLGRLGGGQPIFHHQAARLVARHAQRGLNQLHRANLDQLLGGIDLRIFDLQLLQLQQMVFAL